MILKQEITKHFFDKNVVLITVLLFLNTPSFSQETNTQASGIVKSEDGHVLERANITAVHEATKNTFFTQTNSKGHFFLFNLKPGGPYTVTISFTGFDVLLVRGLYLDYTASNFYTAENGSELSEFVLVLKKTQLSDVTIISKRTKQTAGTELSIDKGRIGMMPSISRNLQDYVRLVPQAKVNGDGLMSFLGQSNRFNTFFVDGANSNDMLGLSNSGTAGGQTNTPPISIEAIEDLKISLSPYDVQYGHFTGASINAITRSGSNQFKSSAWYYFRNEKMAGKSPLPIEKAGVPGVFERTRLNDFFNQTAGVWTSGPVVKNKVFYFLLAEKQDEYQPQPYSFSVYRGTSTYGQITAFADTLRKKYGYEPGSFLKMENRLTSTRINVKLDWNPGTKNKLSFSYRFSQAERIASPSQNSPVVIRFSNNRLGLSSNVNAASFEWKSYLKNSANNRLLLTYNNEVTDRKIVGDPFPAINISDGIANITAGSAGTGHLNLFKAAEFNLLNIIRMSRGKLSFSAGVDINFSIIKDIALNSYFGQYSYRTLHDFMNNAFPFRYVRNLSLVDKPLDDNTKASARFNTLRLGSFVNTEMYANENLKLNFGVRVDGNSLPMNYDEDVFLNTIARPEIEKYYDLEGATSGKTMRPHWQISPRVGFQYKIPEEKITVRGGAGIFTGHILNLWASQFYFANTYNINVVPGNYGLYFNPNPFNQPDHHSLGLDPENSRGSRVLVAKNYKYPTVFRSSLGFDKRFLQNWTLSTDLIVTKNIYEHKYININLVPSYRTSLTPDSRNVYSLTANPENVPLPGGNPYQSIFLLTNNKEKKGFAYNLSFAINGGFNDHLFLKAGYTYGNSFSLLDPGGTSNHSDQWNQIETVNGKNLATRSVSDFDLGHRIFTAITKQINYGNWSTLLTLFYNGQSGSPFSYVYEGTMMSDNSRPSDFDLIYIPTRNDLNNLIFLPISGANPLTAEQQKSSLNDFIEKDKYLRKHRGEFAERNGARLPFTHIIDVRIQQNLRIKTKKKEMQVAISYDIFNFTNLLNRNWGRLYFLTNDNYRLIRFIGFANNTLTPQYQYQPLNGNPWSVQSSTVPGNSARWISQLGLKINFN